MVVAEKSKERIEPHITKEVFRVGGIVFLFSSIIPMIHTIVYLAISRPYRIYTGLSWLILDWLVVVLPLTIPAMIGKRLLYTEKKRRVFLMPAMTFVLLVIIVLIWWFYIFRYYI